MSKHKIASVSCAVLILLVFSRSGWACFGVEKKDQPFLPKYCAFCTDESEQRGTAARERWIRILGDNAQHLHHYCAGINFARKARFKKGKKRPVQVQAQNNFEYVLVRWPENSRLYPEALSRMGRLLEDMGKDMEAATHYQRAIKIKPNYAPAYAAYAEWNVKHSNKEDAIKLLKEGLARVPKSGLLRKRLAALQ